MTKNSKKMESNNTDVLNFLISGKSFSDQYEREGLFTFTVCTGEAANLMIKRYNKEKDGIKKKKNMNIFLFEKDYFLEKIQS